MKGPKNNPWLSPPRQVNGKRHLANAATAARTPPKTEPDVSADIVQLALRTRFNPIRGLTPQILSAHLEQFLLGYVAYAALDWDAIEKRDDVLKGVAAKRRKDVARLDWQIKIVEEFADDPAAKLHKEALEEFYNNISVVNALDENERGGFALLVRQMMDAVGKYYAVHEIVWEPGEILTAEFRFVPLWFFENRTGNLRFLHIPLGGAQGTPLEPGGWMITKGDGLMEACSVAYMFKRAALQDWSAYSEKFGTPGVLGQTNAAKGSDAGNSLRDAVTNFGQNWSGVIYGAEGIIKEPISIVEPKGGANQLPFPPLIERMDRTMAALFRGEDLSTMSRGGAGQGQSVGASVQGDESDILLFDDANMISEALNIYIDRWVLWQKFGVGFGHGRGLAYIEIVAPEEQDLKLDLEIDRLLLESGARMGERERCQYYGRPEMDATDTPLHPPARVTERITEATTGKGAPVSSVETLPNVKRGDAADLEKFLAPYHDEFLKAFANDLQPLRTALEQALQGSDETTQRSQLLTLHAQLPQLLKQMNAAPKSPEVLAKIMANAFAKGFQHK